MKNTISILLVGAAITACGGGGGGGGGGGSSAKVGFVGEDEILSTSPLRFIAPNGDEVTLVGSGNLLVDGQIYRVDDYEAAFPRSPHVNPNDPDGLGNGLASIGYVDSDGKPVLFAFDFVDYYADLYRIAPVPNGTGTIDDAGYGYVYSDGDTIRYDEGQDGEIIVSNGQFSGSFGNVRVTGNLSGAEIVNGESNFVGTNMSGDAHGYIGRSSVDNDVYSIGDFSGTGGGDGYVGNWVW